MERRGEDVGEDIRSRDQMVGVDCTSHPLGDSPRLIPHPPDCLNSGLFVTLFLYLFFLVLGLLDLERGLFCSGLSGEVSNT